jgi:exodeoxyribonuclease V gamma subunit
MLHLHFANRTETLADQLLGRLGGGASLFDADEVVVPSAALQRWLALRIAREQGICTQVRFGFLAQWLWTQLGRLLPGVPAQSPLAPALLAWRLYGVLGDPGFTAAHPRLARYLQDADDVMRWDLAQRIAQGLDRLVTYRADWLERWQRGQLVGFDDPGADADEAWQAALWRRLGNEVLRDTGEALGPLAAGLLHELRRLAPPAGTLPAAAHLFALPAMAPLHLELLRQLGRWMDLHVYVLNPCREYWFEVVDARRLARLALQRRDALHEQGQAQLAAWGGQTQALLTMLDEAAGDERIDTEHYAPHPAGHLLARWQNSVLDLHELAPGSVALGEGDRSVEVHVCHSLTRELEVLHDRLLGLFDAPDAPAPGAVLVAVPDLAAAAPLIDAVFGSAPAERRIPYTITGRPRSRADAPARALLALLDLAGSRCSASAVFALLQQPIVARRFGFGADALETLHQALHEAGVRWGLDGAHRAGFGVPATERHTWADAMARLFLDYAAPDAGEPYGGRLGAGGLAGADAPLLGALWSVLDALAALQRAAARPRSPEDWTTLLLGALAQFTAPDDAELYDLRELQAAIRELAEQMRRGGLREPVPLPVLRAALAQALDDPAHGGVPTGAVTFSALSSLRGVPFEVVCLLGMNDGAFPTAARPPEFDLVARRPRRGDRVRRIDERTLFLDLLLAARRAVYLSYTGRSVRDNAPLPPSVLVAEWLETLVAATAEGDAPAAREQARQRLVVEHPLQAFSPQAFDPASDIRLRSHHRELAEALRAARAPAPAALPDAQDEDDEDAVVETRRPFFGAPVPAAGAEWRTLSVEQLVEFFAYPARTLLRWRLGIDLPREPETLDDDEPFVPDGLLRHALAQRLLPAALAGADGERLRALAWAGTELPEGQTATAALDGEIGALQAFAHPLQAVLAVPALPPHDARVEIAVDAETWTLNASFTDLRPQGLVRWRPGRLRGTDLLGLWLHHLLLCAAPPGGVLARSTWHARDAVVSLRPCDDATAQLQSLLALVRRGLCEPLPFTPKSAWALVQPGGSLPKARSAWPGAPRQTHGERHDPALALAWRGRAIAFDAEFDACARTVFEPLLEHLEGELP